MHAARLSGQVLILTAAWTGYRVFSLTSKPAAFSDAIAANPASPLIWLDYTNDVIAQPVPDLGTVA